LPEDVTVESSEALVIFSTNTANTFSGWEAFYTSTIQNVNEITDVNNLSIYPNPTREKINIYFTPKNKLALINVNIFSILGKLVYSENTDENIQSIDVSNYKKGVYFLEIKGQDFIKIEKIVVY